MPNNDICHKLDVTVRLKLVLLSVSRTGMQQHTLSHVEEKWFTMYPESEKQVMNEQITIAFDYKSKVTKSISESFVKPECGIYNNDVE